MEHDPAHLQGSNKINLQIHVLYMTCKTMYHKHVLVLL